MDGGSVLKAGDAAGNAEIFRCLCRSSPWKWETLRFELRAVKSGAPETEPTAGALRAWTRRPGALRVESIDGKLLYSTTGINDSRDGFYVSSTRKSWLLPPHLVTPVFNDINLVRRRPEAAYGEPAFGNGRWSAMLDPVELAGSAPVAYEVPYANPVEIHELREGEHEGRPVLEALVSPNQTYTPYDAGHPLLPHGRTEVRIDWRTGICVSAISADGPQAGDGHSLTIFGVDEYMLDDLFLEVSMNLTDVREHIPWPVRPHPA